MEKVLLDIERGVCLRVTGNTHDQVDFRHLFLSFYYYIYLYASKYFPLKYFLLSNTTTINYFIIFL